MKGGIFILTVLFLHSFQVSDGGRFGKKCSGHGPHNPPQSNHISTHTPSHQGSHHGSHQPSHSGPHHGPHHEPTHPSENDISQLTGSGSESGPCSSSSEGPNDPPWNKIHYEDKPSTNWFGCCCGSSKKKKPKPVKSPGEHGKGPRCRYRHWGPTPPPTWDLPNANDVV